MIRGKAAEYRLFWIGNEKGEGPVGILMVKRWLVKIIDIIRVRDGMSVIKLLVQEIIISVISVYAPQCGSDDSQKDDFYDILINVVRNLGEKEIVVIAGY